MTLPGEKRPIRLPFEAANCGAQVRVSAWRAGEYDGDPFNIQYDRDQKAREEKRLAAADPVPRQCASGVSADTGQPVMFPRHGELSWGISTKPVHYGEPVSILLWLDNPTDKPQPVRTCMDIDYFWATDIDVFDSIGNRVLSRKEDKNNKAGNAGMELGFSCTRNFPVDIPAHTCAHGTFSSLAYDFSRDLSRYYELSPGRYFVVPAERTRGGKPVNRPLAEPQTGLALDIQEQ